MFKSLAERNGWARDASIRPLPFPDHGYMLPDMGGVMKLLSVTSLVNLFFEGFNADRVIECMMRSAKWGPTHKYYGMTADAIKEMWSARGVEAAELGTRMHAAIECYYNCGEMKHHADVLATPEFAQFQRFVQDATFSRLLAVDGDTYTPDVWIPYRTEWTIYDESARIGGTVDMVYKNVRDGTFTLVDWKRCKEMHTTGKSSAKGVMSYMRDCNFTRYALQIGIYRYILENVYGLIVRDAFVVQFHPALDNYQMHRVPSDTQLYRVTVPKIVQSLRRGAATSSGNWDAELAALIAPPVVPAFAVDLTTLKRSDSWDTGTVTEVRDERREDEPSRGGGLRQTL